MSKSETRDSISSWALYAGISAFLMLAVAHMQMTRLYPEWVYDLTIFSEKILPLSWEMRYLWRFFFVFSAAYGSMAVSVSMQRKPKEYGIYVFGGVGAALLLIGYIPNWNWYKPFCISHNSFRRSFQR